MKLYKVTDANRTTGHFWEYTNWEIGETQTKTVIENPKLCSRDLFHAYIETWQFEFFRRNHGYGGPLVELYEAEGEVVRTDYDKVGVFSLTITKRIPLPHLPVQRARDIACYMFAQKIRDRLAAIGINSYAANLATDLIQENLYGAKIKKEELWAVGKSLHYELPYHHGFASAMVVLMKASKDTDEHAGYFWKACTKCQAISHHDNEVAEILKNAMEQAIEQAG